MNSIKQIIYQIREKPALYLPYNSIRCLKAFIMGWYTGNPDSINDFDLLENEFMKWIHQKYNIEIHSWDRTIEFFSSDEYKALNKFFELFEEFLMEKTQ
jgi:hypothetical protein